MVVLLALLIGGTRGVGWPGRQLGLVALGGMLDTLANLLFTVATTLGNLGIVSILGLALPGRDGVARAGGAGGAAYRGPNGAAWGWRWPGVALASLR